MARRVSMVAFAALLMVLSTAFAPLAMAVPTTHEHGNLPTWQGSSGDQPSYQSGGSGQYIDTYLYFHKTTTSGAQNVLNTQGGSSGVDPMPTARSKTFTLQEPLTKNLKVFGHEINPTHKGFWLDLSVSAAPSATVTIEVLDNENVVANVSQLVTGSFTRWMIPFVGGVDSYTFVKGDKIGVKISTTGSTAVNYANGDKLWVLCDPVSLTADTYNSNGIKSNKFYPNDIDENRHVVVKGKIDDAWGASDVTSVTIDIQYVTTGASVVNATATLDGLNYTYDWNYSKGVQAGAYEAIVTMQDQQSHVYNDSTDFTMAPYGVHLDSPQAQDSGIIQGAAEKGGCTDYTLSVLNIGGAQSSFTISQTSSDVSGWALTISPTQTGNVNPGESKIVNVKVCADESVQEGTYSTFYIQAQSASDPSAKDSIQIMTMASPKVNLSLVWTTSGATCNNLVNTGGSMACSFSVQNTGLQTLNVTLKMTVEKGSPDWSAKVTPANIMNVMLLLHPMVSVTGTLNVTAPKDPSKQNTSIVDISAEVNDPATPLTKVIVAKTVMSTGINVECVGNCKVKVDTGKPAEFFVLVSNTDPNNAHTITMSTTQPTAWSVDFEASNKVFSLNAQESQTISIKVTPASGALAGIYNIEVTGKYQDNANTWDKVVLQVEINEKHQLSLTVSPATKDVGAEQGATFTVTVTNNGNVDEKAATLLVTLRTGDLKATIEIDGNKTSVLPIKISQGKAKTFTVKITPKAEAKHKDAATYDIKVQGATSVSDSKQVTVNLKKTFQQLFMETIKDWQMWILIVLTLVVGIFYAIVARK